MRAPPESTSALVGAALREGARHLGSLLALARVETDANLRALLRLVAILGAIPLFLIGSFFLGLDAAVKLLARPLGSEIVAALIVAAPFLAAAVGLVWSGTRLMALSNLEPWRTWRRGR